jgi:hypothetical protein
VVSASLCTHHGEEYSHLEYGEIKMRGTRRFREMWEVYRCKECGITLRRVADEYYGEDMHLK